MNNRIRKHFTQIPNELINDNTLSRDARFLFVYLCSKPADWKYYVKTIEKDLNFSKDTRLKYMKELIVSGWVEVEQIIKKGGKFGANEIVLNPWPKKSPTVEPQANSSAAEDFGGGKTSPLNNTNTSTNTNKSNNKESIPANETFAGHLFQDQEDSPIKKQEQPGKEKKVAPKKEKEYSAEVKKCYMQCIKLFDEHLRPANKSAQNSWLDTVDKLNRIDKIPFDLITSLVERVRADSFWARNFLSLAKLRKTNKDGIKYIIVFSEQFKERKPIVTPHQQAVADKEIKDYLNI